MRTWAGRCFFGLVLGCSMLVGRASWGQSAILSFVGDVTLGQNEKLGADATGSFNYFYQRYGEEYFFRRVRETFMKSDLVIANLEGVLADCGEMIAKTENPGYWLRGAPEYSQILFAGGITTVNLANNHTGDFGAEGLSSTREAVTAAQLAYFGGGEILIQEIVGIKVGFYGLTLGQASKSVQQRLQERLKEAGAEVIIANLHGGQEGSSQPTWQQIASAKQAIDLGADVVIEHHAHVMQGIGSYKQKLIAFSLGNFCFGGNRNPRDKDTLILQLRLERMMSGEISISHVVIPAQISSSATTNNYQPQVLEGEEAERVLAKLEKLSSKLKFGN